MGKITYAQLARMEGDLLSIERRANVEKCKPFYLRRDDRIEALRAEYKELHALWKAAKQQMAFEV